MDPEEILLATSRNASLMPSRSTKHRPVENSETSPERIEQKLAEFFTPCRLPTTPYTDPEFQRISELLKNMGRPAWASIPRIYTVLRIIGQLEHLDVFIQQSITDIWFPFSANSLPGQLSPSMSTKFLDCQSIVLTKWMNLEKGLDHKHAHFGEDDALPLEIMCPLGKGGFGNVDKVLSLLSGREFARKRFRRRGLRNKSEIASFRTELMILKRLRHHHCIELVGSYTDSRYFGLIMSPVADCNMLEFYSLVTQSPDRMSLMREFFGCLTNALLYLHDSKIRHRDVKPTNILVKGNSVYVTDFGISHDFGSLTKSTTTADSAKTMMYAAPEVVEVRPRNTKADIWSLGCVFLEMVTVLKGAKIEDMRNHFNRRTESRCFWANGQAITEWMLNLQEMGTREDNALLGWIGEMLNLDERLRPTAKLLFDNIVSYDPQIDEPVSFCGSCCREEIFTESEDSGSEAWEQEEEEFTSSVTTRSFKSQPSQRKRYRVTETKNTVVGDAATVHQETGTTIPKTITPATNPWSKYLPRTQNSQEVTVSSAKPTTNASSSWEDFFASLDTVFSDSPQQRDYTRSISSPPSNPWHSPVGVSEYQRDALLPNLQLHTSLNQHTTSTFDSDTAAISNQRLTPPAQTDVQAFAPTELPNESRIFEAPTEVPPSLLNNFYQTHPSLKYAVDFKEHSWGIDPPKLSLGHWASPNTLLLAIKTDMRFMKALKLNHPMDFGFVANSSPQDLPKILGCMILSGFIVAALNHGFQSPLLLTAAYQPPDLSADITQILLIHGAKPDVRTGHGKTPLMVAAREGNAASVTLLLKYGAPVNSRDEYGETALDKALIGGYESIAGILLGYGASSQSRRLPPHLITPEIQERLILENQDNKEKIIDPRLTPTSAQTSNPISASTQASPPAYTSTFTPGSPPAYISTTSYTPVSAVPTVQPVELPSIPIIPRATEFPTTTKSQKKSISRSPVPSLYDSRQPSNAIDYGHVPIFYTPPLPLLTARDWTGPSYFLQAVKSHQPLMDLIKGENHILHEYLVSTPIGDTSPDSLAAVARVLMRGGLNINLLLRASQTGPTPLQYVLEWGPEHSEMFNLMVRHGAIINQAGADGSTVLTLACSKGHLWAIRYLIDSGVKIDEQTGPQLINPLLCAAKFGQLGAVASLISKGANIEVRNSEGRSPLVLAAQFGHASIMRVLLDKGASISIRSTDPQSPDLSDATALDHAAFSGNTEVVSLLLDAGAGINEPTGKFGSTILGKVAQKGLTEMAAFLISHNADINVSDLTGSTPISAAASAGHTEMVKLLLQHGANVNPKAERLAKKNNHKEIVSLLRETKRTKGGFLNVSFR